VTDRVVLPFGPELLVLTAEEFAAARQRGRELTQQPSSSCPGPAAPVLVGAEELGRMTSTAASWWESAARDLDCPSTFVGNRRRFRVADCLAWLESAQERNVGGKAVRCGAAPRARA
jgi:hypothetical protein